MLERLVAESSAAVDTRVVMVTGQGARDSEVRFAEELGLDARQVVPLDLRRLRLRHVPSAVVVDRDGTVLFSRSGPISEQDLESVKRLVGTP
jgi:predicted transcriptional regulator